MKQLVMGIAFDHSTWSYKEICSKLGPGDSGWNAGDPIRDVSFKIAKQYPFTRWFIYEQSEFSSDWPLLSERILQRFKFIADRATSLSQESNFRTSFIVELFEVNTVFGMGFSREILEMIHSLSASIEISVVVE
jgi:hypothetical protein